MAKSNALSSREYRARNPEKRKETSRKYREKHKDEILAYNREQRKQRAARMLAARHNPEPPEFGCALCESKDNLERHHPDIEHEPASIIWLCRRCHHSIFDVAVRSKRICLLSDVPAWTEGCILGDDSSVC